MTMDVHAEIEVRDSHLRSQKRFTLVALIGMAVALVVSLLVNLALIIAFNSYPKTQWVWTQDAKAVCEAIPLTEPNISQALLADFAARAAISVHTYDYINWRENLSYAVQNYFTPVGGRYFIDSFARSNILRQVQRNFYVVSAVTDGAPLIESTGIDHGRMFWKVEVPITITYRFGADYKAERRIIQLTVLRVDPTPANPNGVAIDGFVSVQNTNARRK
ncbi:DotI/IcmL family type IV secretion protein [Paracoccus sp. TOH]|uniref:DotI/IcmL family type IV secretion protein n=1 Tax=Paracoccus sp. TOH TaxID=1263728 RepID=UPI0025B19B49|nr:DotI/IcmL family type IV secretion protein [Paracoccus sp. TOH]WJS87255.1 DotI/IcmL family type IV secretion protein [Paracoccus sp. TOH]